MSMVSTWYYTLYTGTRWSTSLVFVVINLPWEISWVQRQLSEAVLGDCRGLLWREETRREKNLSPKLPQSKVLPFDIKTESFLPCLTIAQDSLKIDDMFWPQPVTCCNAHFSFKASFDLLPEQINLSGPEREAIVKQKAILPLRQSRKKWTFQHEMYFWSKWIRVKIAIILDCRKIDSWLRGERWYLRRAVRNCVLARSRLANFFVSLHSCTLDQLCSVSPSTQTQRQPRQQGVEKKTKNSCRFIC